MFKDGDSVFVVQADGRPVAGEIVKITPNQVAVLLKFNGMIGVHPGIMAVQRHDTKLGIYRSIIDGTEITMRSRAVATTEERETTNDSTTTTRNE